jgi:hypothetical protein
MRETRKEPETTEQAPETFRVEALAREAGIFPEVAGRSVNQRFWIFCVLCGRRAWTEHTRVTRTEFDAAMADATGPITLR